MAYIFIVKYSVLFGLFNFGLGLGLLNFLFGLGLDLGLGLKHLASINISVALLFWVLVMH